MSFKTRLGLLASSSLIAAGLSAAASLGTALVPAAASAQTCTPNAATVTGSGPGADTVTCTAGTFATGITYNSNGDLSVSLLAGANSNITANGVNLTGNGADNVTWANAGNVLSGAGTAGPLLDVTTVSGAITVTTNGIMNANAAGATHGIRATSTGGGDIAITRMSGVNNNVAGGLAAIEAVTNGGDISITAAGVGNTQGRARGIVAQTSGSGVISISVGTAVSASATDGVAAIDTIAGTGATTINTNSGALSGGAGLAIRSVSAGAVTVQGTLGSVSGRVDFSGVAGGVTFTSSWFAEGASVFSAVADTVRLSTLAAGASVDFGGGNDTVTQASGSLGAGTLTFGAGADAYVVSGNIAAGAATLDFGADADALNVTGKLRVAGTTLAFGAGADALNQSGDFFWNGGTISGLEAFNNSGTIYMGGEDYNIFGPNSDSVPDDTLTLSSGVFTGSGDSRIVLDANLGTHAAQVGCASPTIADCLNFTGATTAGSTPVKVRDISFSVDGGTIGAPVTVIQGATAAEHFTLDPESDYYVETADGGVIRKPIVAYRFVYDDANQRHLLIGTPTDEPFQVGTFAAAAQEAWRLTTGSWLSRQADLRATPGGLQASRAVWGRVSAQASEREAAASFEQGGIVFDYDLSQKQKIADLTFGADVFGHASGDVALVVGAMVGFVRSDVEFDATTTEAITSGFSGGLYASYLAGPLFIDATANANILHVKAEAPAMGLGLDVPMRFDLKSLGGQVEAGWRLGMDSGLFVEPLVGASYVVTRIDDSEVPGGAGQFAFEESKSLRLGAGARVGLDSEMAGMAASYSLTGRYWNESEGQGSATVTTASGSSALLLDELSGGFGEVVASLNFYSDDGGLSGFVNLGGRFADGYQAVDGSVGVRVRW